MSQKRKREVARRETKEIDTSWLQQDAQPSTETTTQPAWPALSPSTKPRRRSATATERPPSRQTVKPPR